MQCLLRQSHLTAATYKWKHTWISNNIFWSPLQEGPKIHNVQGLANSIMLKLPCLESHSGLSTGDASLIPPENSSHLEVVSLTWTSPFYRGFSPYFGSALRLLPSETDLELNILHHFMAVKKNFKSLLNTLLSWALQDLD